VRQALTDHLVWGYAFLFHGYAFVLYSLSLFLVSLTSSPIIILDPNVYILISRQSLQALDFKAGKLSCEHTIFLSHERNKNTS